MEDAPQIRVVLVMLLRGRDTIVCGRVVGGEVVCEAATANNGQLKMQMQMRKPTAGTDERQG